MILQEDGPALVTTRLAWRSLRHVLAHCPRRDPNPTLHQQLVGNSLLAPYRVLCGHLSNQPAQFRRNRWSARPSLQAPDPPAQSVPANDGRWPHGDHCIAPIEHSGKQREADARCVIQASGLDVTPDVTAKFRRGDPAAFDFLVMLVLSNVIHDFDVARVPMG